MENKKEQPLIEKIALILKQNPRGLSIAGFERALKKELNQGIHRVYLGGYLQAFSQMGILEELDFKPSKVFRLRRGAMEKFHGIMETMDAIAKIEEDVKDKMKIASRKTGELKSKISKVLEGGDR